MLCMSPGSFLAIWSAYRALRRGPGRALCSTALRAGLAFRGRTPAGLCTPDNREERGDGRAEQAVAVLLATGGRLRLPFACRGSESQTSRRTRAECSSTPHRGRRETAAGKRNDTEEVHGRASADMVMAP